MLVDGYDVDVNSYLGIDVGGSSIKLAVVATDGSLLSDFITAPHKTADALDVITSNASRLSQAHEVVGIGIGSPGYLNADQTEVMFAPNLGWNNQPLVAAVKQATGLPAFLDGDANIAALGEATFGAAKGSHSSLHIALGTGIGGALVIEGKIWRGAHGAAGNVGHFPIPGAETVCACGLMNCWETKASARALSQQTGTARAEITPEWLDNLAIGLTPLLGLFDPEVVVFGGAISESADDLIPEVAARIQKFLLSSAYLQTPRYVRATLGAQAGVIGAATYAAQCLEVQS